MNECYFSGNLGGDIELREVGQNKVVNVNMAVNKKIKGEKTTTWVALTFWNQKAELLQQYCQKGSKLLVRCEFELQEWEKDGQKRQSPKFTVQNMEFIGGGQQQQSPQPTQQNQNYQQPPTQQPPQSQPAPQAQPQQQPNVPNDDFIEDDIPF